MAAETEILSAPHVLEYPYKRTVGPVLGRFLGALKEGRLEGVRTASGRVLMPPAEYDPDTGEAVTDEFVEVGPGGTVETWTWVDPPRPKHPLERPFAWALVKLDGADTSMLHVVDAGDAGAMSTGMRVAPRWREERKGHVLDVEAFVPEGSS